MVAAEELTMAILRGMFTITLRLVPVNKHITSVGASSQSLHTSVDTCTQEIMSSFHSLKILCLPKSCKANDEKLKGKTIKKKLIF